jgi:hypothetical protein
MNTTIADRRARIRPSIRSKPLAFLAGLYLSCQAGVYAQTTAGTITGSETWSGSILLTGDVVIEDGGTVTIQAGTTVRVATGDSANLEGNPSAVEFVLKGGTLRVLGTSDAPVAFVSASGTPAVGDWGGIIMRFGTADLRYLRQSHAGTGLRILGGGDYTFTGCSFSDNADQGVHISATGRYEFTGLTCQRNGRHGLVGGSSNPNIVVTGGLISDNGWSDGAESAVVNYGLLTLSEVAVLRNAHSGVEIQAGGGPGAFPLRMENCRVEDNGSTGISLAYTGGVIVGTRVLRNAGDGIYRYDGQGRVMALQGCDVSFNAGSGLHSPVWSGTAINDVSDCSFRSNGGLGIIGSGEFSVLRSTFTSNREGVSAGRLSLVDSTLTGHSGTAVLFSGSLLPAGFTGNQIRNNGLGVDCQWNETSGVVQITRNDIHGNSGTDLRNGGTAAIVANGNWWGASTTTRLQSGEVNPPAIVSGYDDPALGQVLYRTFRTGPITDPSATEVAFTNPPFAGASRTVSGVISASQTWAGTVFVEGDIEIPEGTTLTIEAGARLVFNARRDTLVAGGDSSGVEVLLNGGTLRVLGTSNAPVVFGSSAGTPESGDWAGILFRFGTADLRHLHQSSGGTGLRILGGGDYEFASCSFSDNADQGVHISATGRYEFVGLTSQRNGRHGLVGDGGAAGIVVTGGLISDNGWSAGSEAAAVNNGSLTLSDVAVLRNAHAGVEIQAGGGPGAFPLRMENCRVEDNGATGISLTYTGGFIVGTRVLRNTGDGIYRYDGQGRVMTLQGCDVSFNAGSGFHSPVWSGTVINEVSDSTFRSNGGLGIVGSGEFSVLRSTFASNREGIAAGRLSLMDSTLTGNAGTAVLFSGGLLPGGITGNQIRNNGLGIDSQWNDPAGVIEITRNDIHGNSGTDIRAGGPAEVRAVGNFHGTTTTRELVEGRVNLSQIQDVNDVASLGRVVISGWLEGSIAVSGPPTIGTQPQSTAVVLGGQAAFEVAATGAQPLSYRWQFAGVDLVEGGRVTGVGTSRLSLASIIDTDAGSYRVIVANSSGATTSAVASLLVLLPSTNRPPVPGVVADVRVDAGKTVAVTLTAADPDSPTQQLAFSLVNAPLGATLTTGGSFSWTVPAEQPAGTVTLLARVTDNGTPSASADFSFRIVVSRPLADQPPTLSSFQDLRTEVDQGMPTIPFTVGDDLTAPSALVIQVSSTNQVLVPEQGISLSGSGTDRQLLIRPAPGQSGETVIVVSVTDGSGQTTERSFRLSVCPCDGPSLEIDLLALLTIHGEVGTTYRIEYADAADGAWHFLGTIRLQRTPQTYIDASVSARQHRLYRVIATAASANDESEAPGALVPLVR